jgi:hypothetical protein
MLLRIIVRQRREIICRTVVSEQFNQLRFIVSHSSTIKMWMNGALRFLVVSRPGHLPTCHFQLCG